MNEKKFIILDHKPTTACHICFVRFT